MQEWWLSLSEPMQVAIVGAGATCLAALVGFTAVFIQIGRQSRNAIEQNRQNEALKRKVEIYERSLEISREAANASSELTGYLRRFDLNVDFAKIAVQEGGAVLHPTARFPEYQDFYGKAVSAFISVMGMIEGWHIVEPRLNLFRRAIGMGLYELSRVTSTSPNPYVYAMPVQGRENMWRVPDDSATAALKDRIELETYHVDRIAAWVGDFQVEMQILLLGELFPNKVERRDPPDPNQFCIRLDRYEQIDKILNSSDWTKRNFELEAEAWANYSNSPDADNGAPGTER